MKAKTNQDFLFILWIVCCEFCESNLNTYILQQKWKQKRIDTVYLFCEFCVQFLFWFMFPISAHTFWNINESKTDRYFRFILWILCHVFVFLVLISIHIFFNKNESKNRSIFSIYFVHFCVPFLLWFLFLISTHIFWNKNERKNETNQYFLFILWILCSVFVFCS